MDILRSMALFVQIAETGSFKQAAENMNCSTSLISKEISKLETNLGARLLQRSTRKIQLTEIGHGYLEHCHKILASHQQAQDYVQEMQKKPAGRLKINAPMTLGITDLGRAFASFSLEHPEIELEVVLSDDSVDLLDQGYDIGFRASSGNIDVNYIGRSIAQFSLHIVSTPKYLTAHDQINTLEQLSEHNFYTYSLAMKKKIIPLNSGISVRGSLSANNTIFIKEALLQGGGIALLPSFVCKKEIQSGELVELFTHFTLPKLNFYLLYPSRKHTPPKLTKFIEFMVKWFEKENDMAR